MAVSHGSRRRVHRRKIGSRDRPHRIQLAGSSVEMVRSHEPRTDSTREKITPPVSSASTPGKFPDSDAWQRGMRKLPRSRPAINAVMPRKMAARRGRRNRRVVVQEPAIPDWSAAWGQTMISLTVGRSNLSTRRSTRTAPSAAGPCCRMPTVRSCRERAAACGRSPAPV